jgi:hypothetical protein
MRSTTLFLLASMSAGLLAAEGEDKVQIHGFGVEPYGNLGNTSHTLTVHPKALLTLGTDSNLYATDSNETSDQFIGGTVGVLANWASTEAIKVGLDLEVDGKRYMDETDRNLVGGKGTLTVDWKGDVAVAGADASYARVDDPDVQTGERIQHRDLDGGATLGWEGVDTKGSLRVGGRDVRYLEDAGGFVADTRSNSGVTGAARFALLGGSDTEVYASVKASSWRYVDDAVLNNGEQIAPTVGLQTKVGERSGLVVEVGVDARSYDKVSNAGADDKSALIPIGTAAFNCPTSDSLTLSAKAFGLGANSLTSNAYSLYGAELGGRWLAVQQLTLFANVVGTRVKDTDAGTGAVRETRETIIGSIGAEYQAIRGLAFRLTGRQTSSNAVAGAGTDYDRTEVLLDSAFVF